MVRGWDVQRDDASGKRSSELLNDGVKADNVGASRAISAIGPPSWASSSFLWRQRRRLGAFISASKTVNMSGARTVSTHDSATSFRHWRHPTCHSSCSVSACTNVHAAAMRPRMLCKVPTRRGKGVSKPKGGGEFVAPPESSDKAWNFMAARSYHR